ncbi:RNB domain-containing ribonuclease [Escherichia coli]
MDDALFAKALPDDKLQLHCGDCRSSRWIAEAASWTSRENSSIHQLLPGFNIPMLPRRLSDDLCSLRANEVRPVLACRVTLSADGTIEDNIEFFAPPSNPKQSWCMTRFLTGWKIPVTGSLKVKQLPKTPFASANLPTPRRVAS